MIFEDEVRERIPLVAKGVALLDAWAAMGESAPVQIHADWKRRIKRNLRYRQNDAFDMFKRNRDVIRHSSVRSCCLADMRDGAGFPRREPIASTEVLVSHGLFETTAATNKWNALTEAWRRYFDSLDASMV